MRSYERIGGSRARSNFDFAGPLTEAVLPGMVCVRNGGDTLLWDSANLKVTNDADANRFLHYDHRPGWEVQAGRRTGGAPPVLRAWAHATGGAN